MTGVRGLYLAVSPNSTPRVFLGDDINNWLPHLGSVHGVVSRNTAWGYGDEIPGNAQDACLALRELGFSTSDLWVNISEGTWTGAVANGANKKISMHLLRLATALLSKCTHKPCMISE